jgi:hypothetical protein
MDLKLSNLRWPALATADFACLVASGVIVLQAMRDWPARYRLHSLSWSIAIYFIVFVALSVLGPAVAWYSWRTRNYQAMFGAAGAPVWWFGLGAAIGVLKLLATGDL